MIFGICGTFSLQNSVLVWCARHRIHHRFVDQIERDPLLRWQHRYYRALTWTLNLGVPMLIGLLVGDLVGVVLLAGAVRLVFSQHSTFFINSLAHSWGKRHYSEDNSSRDNGWLALLTWGEGYHNFHHAFQADYRNGARWCHFDPGKWLIALSSSVGLASQLKHTPGCRISRIPYVLQRTDLHRHGCKH